MGRLLSGRDAGGQASGCALDMWGSKGSMRRRRIIRAEFVLGAVGCMALGLLAVVQGGGWIVVLGIWLVGAGVNYIPLALHAQSLSRPGALEAELAGVDVGGELRQAGVQQFWIAVPLAIAASRSWTFAPVEGRDASLPECARMYLETRRSAARLADGSADHRPHTRRRRERFRLSARLEPQSLVKGDRSGKGRLEVAEMALCVCPLEYRSEQPSTSATSLKCRLDADEGEVPVWLSGVEWSHAGEAFEQRTAGSRVERSHRQGVEPCVAVGGSRLAPRRHPSGDTGEPVRAD